MSRIAALIALALLALAGCSDAASLTGVDASEIGRPTLQDGTDPSSNNGQGGGQP